MIALIKDFIVPTRINGKNPMVNALFNPKEKDKYNVPIIRIKKVTKKQDKILKTGIFKEFLFVRKPIKNTAGKKLNKQPPVGPNSTQSPEFIFVNTGKPKKPLPR